MVRIALIIFSCAWLLISQVLFLPAAQAQEALWRLIGQSTTYIFYLRPTVYKNYLDFPGPANSSLVSKPLPIVKVTISYAYLKSGVMSDEIPYETLWYRGSDPLGCRRYANFNTDLNYNVYAYLSSCSSLEQAACANALVRLYLDMILNRHQIMAVEVPGQSLRELIAQLQQEHFYTPSKLPGIPPIYNTLTLIDGGPNKQTVTYYNYF